MISVAEVINGPAVTRRSSRALSPGDKKVFLWILVYLPLIFLGSCGLLVVGSVKSCYSNIEERERVSAERAAAEERERAARESEQLKAAAEQRRAEEAEARKREEEFQELPAATHLARAEAAMSDNYDAKKRTGGNIELARKHLLAIWGSLPESAKALELLKECDERQDGGVLSIARLDMKQGHLDWAESGLKQLSAHGQRSREVTAFRALLAAEKRRPKKKEYITYRTLYCEDGTESPTCTCGGSWRGCCSHHGGVDGCRTVRIEKKESASIAQPNAFDH